jgi:hypothetical protein
MRKRFLTRQVGAVISKETYRELIEITDKMEISTSNFIRDAIQEKINQCKGEENNE